MLSSHIFWALLGMLGYSATTLLVKFAARTGLPSTVAVAIATSIVTATCWLIVAARGQTLVLFQSLGTLGGVWSVAAGVAMAIAVMSLFRALELGPASVVVPVYGMFIVGGFVLGVIFLGEVLTPAKLVGVAAAVAGIYLICA
jgi:bacterial/archaeal transporter family protein